MSWTRVAIDDLLENFADRWNALNCRLYQGHPLFDSRFVFALLRHFPSERVAAWALGPLAQPRAILLLEQVRPGAWSTFQRSQAQASPVLIAPEDVHELGSLFGALSPLAQYIDFLCQDPEYSPWRQLGGRIPSMRAGHALTASIALDGSFDDYWRRRPRGLRQTISRSMRRAAEEGAPMVLSVVEDAGRIADSVSAFGRLESEGWKREFGTAVNPENEQGRFYADVFEAFARTGQAISYELHAGTEVIARQLALAGGTMCITLKTTYDERKRHLSPGRVLDYEMLRLEFDRQRFGKIELYTDADRAQLRWTTHTRNIEHVTCFRSVAARTTYTIARSALAGLRRLAGNSPGEKP